MGSPKALLTLPTNETLLDYHIRHASDFAVPILIADNEQQFMSQLAADRHRIPTDIDIQPIDDYQPSDIKAGNHTDSKANHPMDNKGHLDSDKGVGPLGAIAAAMQQLTLDSGFNSNSKLVSNTDIESNSSIKPISDQSLADAWLMVISCDSLVTATSLWQVLTQSYELEAANAKAKTATVMCLSDPDHLYPLLGLYHLSLTDELMAYLDNGERRVMRFIEPKLRKVAMRKQWKHLTNLNTPEAFERACQHFVNVHL